MSRQVAPTEQRRDDRESNGRYFSDLVSQEPDLHAERSARTGRLLAWILVLILPVVVFWTIAALYVSDSLATLINGGATFSLATARWLIHRGRIRLAVHVAFWTGYATVWLIILRQDGPTTNVTRMSQFWFIFLASVGYLLIDRKDRRFADLYAIICGLSFAAVHFDIFRIETIGGFPDNVRTPANVVMLLIVLGLTALVSNLFVNDILTGETRLERANHRLEQLLENMLPHSVAEKLKLEGRTFAQGFPEVTILFADLVGLNEFADRNPPTAVVGMLDTIFSRLDELCDCHGLEKIKTAGGVYMVVAGVPEARADHAEAIARFALKAIDVADDYPGIEVKIGINSGPVVAGVIGTNRLIYDLWGDSVNLAQRMELHGIPGRIQVSESTASLLEKDFVLEHRGRIPVKGKSELDTYLLLGAREATRISP